jgi:hypothetical protein
LGEKSNGFGGRTHTNGGIVMALSERQQRIFNFIIAFQRTKGRPPTIREIGAHVGISSTSVVNYNLNILVREGLIKRENEISRGLRVELLERKSIPSDRNRIFLCHASEDKSVVRDLYKELRDEGFYMWLDEEDILPGEDWEMKIKQAISRSLVVVVCLSQKASTKVGYIQKEIRIALDIADQQPEGTIFLIPVRIEECNVPERLCHLQWVNLFEKEGLGKLKRALWHRFKASNE